MALLGLLLGFGLGASACLTGPTEGPGSDTLGSSGLPGPGDNGVPNGSGNPATRPTPGFTELELKPATSTTLPPPSSFLKGLVIVDNLIEVTDVRMFLRDVALEDGADYSSPGPFLVRLIRGDVIVDESFPEFGTQSVPQGSYERSDLGFQILQAGQIPPELADDSLVTALVGHSIIVEGQVDLDFFPLPLRTLLALLLPEDFLTFRFISDQTVDLRVEAPTPFDLNLPDQTLFIAFKVKTWLDQGLFGIVTDLLADLNLVELTNLLLGNLLVFDTSGGNATLKGIALSIEANINTSLRFALSPDDIFDEAEVDENSFSDVLP